MKGVEVHELALHTDARGWLLKAVAKSYTDGAPFGEIYVVGALPGQVRANHYHREATEWFAVLRGTAQLTLADADSSDADRREISMGGEDRICVKIPPFVGHAVTVTGSEEMVLLAFTDRPYDRSSPDTYPLVLVPPARPGT